MSEKRNREIQLLRERGKTYEEIGIKFCITRERVYQICQHNKRHEKMRKEFPDLQIRTIYLLRRNGIKTMNELETEYLNNSHRISEIKGIGKKMMLEIDNAIRKYERGQE